MQISGIPEDQLQRILPVVDSLRASLSLLLKDLPLDAESALDFDPSPRIAQ